MLNMRIPGTYRIGLMCSVIALWTFSAPVNAAKNLHDAQLEYLFSGSEMSAKGGRCTAERVQYTAPTNYKLSFKNDQTIAIHIDCNVGAFTGRVSDGIPWTADETGTWRIESNSICIESDGPVFSKTQLTNDTCWVIREGRFGYESFDPAGVLAWRLSIVSHPKHDSKEELMASVKTIEVTQMAVASSPVSISAAASDSAAWEAIKYSNRISDFQRYLETYPNGLFVALAENQIRDLVNAQSNPAAVTNEFADVDFGNYHALVIGINNYKYITKLGTAIRDAEAVAETLEMQYGFKVQTLIDPDRADIVDAFDEYRETLTDKDNLLIYYAGHGWLDEEAEEGYWLTAKAKSNRRSQWVSNATITKTLKTLPAKHVMVVADSCYSGTLTRAAAVGFRDKDYFKRMAGKKARVAMVSGGLEPVADDSGSGNSPFAKAFIDALSKNKDVIDGTRLFSQIRRPVILNAQQTPEYSDVRNADHDGGDFLFVRKQ